MESDEEEAIKFTELTYERTSRRIMEGTAFVRNSQL